MNDKKPKTKQIKTADYTRKAINNYQQNKKLITVTLDRSDYEKLCKIGVTGSADIRRILLDYLEKYEKR